MKKRFATFSSKGSAEFKYVFGTLKSERFECSNFCQIFTPKWTANNLPLTITQITTITITTK